MLIFKYSFSRRKSIPAESILPFLWVVKVEVEPDVFLRNLILIPVKKNTQRFIGTLQLRWFTTSFPR